MSLTKYRVWCKDKGRFLSDNFLGQLFLRKDGNVVWYSVEKGFEDITDRIDIEFYTGIKDMSNKEICEGDVVTGLNGCGKRDRREVEYLGACFYPLQDDDEFYWSDIEIIGNVHDDPHLLKEGDQK